MPRKTVSKKALDQAIAQAQEDVAKVTEPNNTPEFAIDELPPDIQEAIRVVSGGRPRSFEEEFQPNTEGYPQFKGAAFGGSSAQEEFIKQKDPQEIRMRYTDNKCYAIDLATPEGTAKYEEIMKDVGDPESGVIFAEPPKEPHIVLDATCERGFRAIVVLKTSKPVPYRHRIGTGYQVVDPLDEEKLDDQPDKS